MNKIIKEFKQLNNQEWKAKTEDDINISVVNLDEYITIYLIISGHRAIIHKEFCPISQTDTNIIRKMLKFNGFTFQTEKTYDVDYENFKDNNTAEAFQHWWNEEGSSFTTEENEYPEEFMKRICGIAWNNGSFKGGG